ncbi:MAG: class I SAM-dependent methyltransferase, partial [Phenylobacterium sp.]|nr:class I SAM-dependent methyltransferase [Phenylobacterium sp.]
QAPLDRQLEPLGRRVMAAIALQPGEQVLDVGCGAGATTLALAQAVSPDGAATGADISRPMLDIARTRSAGLPATFLEADAQTHPFPAGAFDAVFSRFGVMFFADPTAAFANLRRALKPGGRLGFVCWRTPAENPVMTLPMAAALPLVATPPAPPEPGAPGPFAFADPERVRTILADAGFTHITVTPHDEKIGAGDLDTVLGLSLRIGPLGALLRENPDQRDAVIEAVRVALAPHEGPDGVKLDSATWIVTASNPG